MRDPYGKCRTHAYTYISRSTRFRTKSTVCALAPSSDLLQAINIGMRRLRTAGCASISSNCLQSHMASSNPNEIHNVGMRTRSNVTGCLLSNGCLLSHEIHRVDNKNNAPCVVNIALNSAAYFGVSWDVHKVDWPTLLCLLSRQRSEIIVEVLSR